VKLNRSELTKHLKRIQCEGQITEASFRKGLATWALTSDHLLLVDAPALKGASKLIGKSEEVGIVDLPTVVRACGLIQGDDAEKVDVSFVDNRFVINEDEEGSILLLTAEPRTIATRTEEEVISALNDKIGDHEVPLLPRLIAKVQATFSGLKAERVLVQVDKKGGQVSVGGEFAHEAHLPVPELKAKEPYELMFGAHLIDVLKTVQEPTAVLKLSGAGGVVAIQDGEYRYMLSPRARTTEAAPTPPEDEEE
jgi:hypothetical protein